MRRTALSLALVLTGCAVEPAEVATPGQESKPLPDTCDDFVCTGNSPIVGGVEFWRMHEKGFESFMGFRIAQIRKGVTPVIDFDVIGARPHAWMGATEIQDAGWIGVDFVLDTPDGTQKVVRVNDWRHVDFYDGLPGPEISAFRLQYVVPPEPGSNQTQWADVCTRAEPDVDGLPGTWAIMSQGDDFDKDTTSIALSGPAVGFWFNISCAGDAISKLIRIRHAYAVMDAGHKTSQAQRQAALRMFTSKICDDGPLFTHKGQPLTWEDRAPWSTMVETQAFEAIWTEHGAACMVTPRMYPLEQIQKSCPNVKTCTQTQIDNWRSRSTNYLISAIPADD